MGGAIAAEDIAIRDRFDLGGAPTPCERALAEVAAECIEIVEQVARGPEAGTAETVANAIRELFSPDSPPLGGVSGSCATKAASNITVPAGAASIPAGLGRRTTGQPTC